MKLMIAVMLLAQMSFAKPIVNTKLKKAVKKYPKTELCDESAIDGEVLFVEDINHQIVKDTNVFTYGSRLRVKDLTEDDLFVGAQFQVDVETSDDDDFNRTKYNVYFTEYAVCDDGHCDLSIEKVPVCTGEKVRLKEAVILK